MATATVKAAYPAPAGMPPGLVLSIPMVIRCEGCGAAATEERPGFLVMIHSGLCPAIPVLDAKSI
jgi:hypothetical protein